MLKYQLMTHLFQLAILSRAEYNSGRIIFIKVVQEQKKNMNKELTTQFIDRLEQVAQSEEARTKALSYQLVNKVVPMKDFLNLLVKDARYYLDCNEWLIALENTVCNLYETDIKLDNDIVDIARKAFGEHLKDYDWQHTLDEMTGND
jgi:hypothetical protein